jgi:hypothetical protein
MLGVQAGDNLLNGHKKVQIEDISTTPTGQRNLSELQR